MIIYGLRRKDLKTFGTPNYKCESCGEFHSTQITVQLRYVHLFWLPLLAIGKTGKYRCGNCGKSGEKKFPDRLKLHLDNFKPKTSTPLTFFIGPALVVGVIMYSVVASNKASENRDLYLKEPKTGDVYFYEKNPGSYSSMKVSQVKEDSVFVVENTKSASKIMKVFGLNQPENYRLKAKAHSRKDILKMYADKVIFSIDRKESVNDPQ